MASAPTPSAGARSSRPETGARARVRLATRHPVTAAIRGRAARVRLRIPGQASTYGSLCGARRPRTGSSVTNPRIRASLLNRGHTSTSTWNTYPQQLRPYAVAEPAAPASLRRLARRRHDRCRCGQLHLAPPPPHPPPRRVRSRVAHPHLVALPHVIHPARDELQRRHAVHLGVGARDPVRRKLHLGALGVVTQSRIGHRSAGAVACTRSSPSRSSIGGPI